MFIRRFIKIKKETKTHQPQQASYLKSDVIKLAAVADGGSAGMDHAVHLNNARAAPGRFPGPFSGGASRWRAAGRGFAFDSLLARHISRFQKYLYEARFQQAAAKANWTISEESGREMGWKVAAEKKFNLADFSTCALETCSWNSLCLLRTASCSWQTCKPQHCALGRQMWCARKLHLERKAVRTEASVLYLHIKNSFWTVVGPLAFITGDISKTELEKNTTKQKKQAVSTANTFLFIFIFLCFWWAILKLLQLRCLSNTLAHLFYLWIPYMPCSTCTACGVCPWQTGRQLMRGHLTGPLRLIQWRLGSCLVWCNVS